MILMILNSLTIRTALVAALEVFDWAASWATDELEVAKIKSVKKLTSKIMEIVETMSRKKKKERKYFSINSELRTIYIKKIPITTRLVASK